MVKPYSQFQSATEHDRQVGEQLIADGKVAALVLAGGEGSRLGHSGPKGTYPVAGKTLYQHVCEKGRGPVIFMTSAQNQFATQTYLADHNNFGADVHFITQDDLPLLDLERQPVGELAAAGNGWAIKHLIESKILSENISYVMIIPVDNPLADPFDAELVGHLHSRGSELALRCVERVAPTEKMGVLVEDESGPKVIEYMHLDPEHAALDGLLGSTGIFCLTRDFAQVVAEKSDAMPLHEVRKRGLIKRERFLFDMIPFAQKFSALLSERTTCFAPLKSVLDVKNILSALDRVPHSG